MSQSEKNSDEDLTKKRQSFEHLTELNRRIFVSLIRTSFICIVVLLFVQLPTFWHLIMIYMEKMMFRY